MYKNFNITEEEKQQILENHSSAGYKQPKTQMDEQGFRSMIKNMISPEVKILRGGTYVREIGASPAVKSLLTKFGTVQMTDFVKASLRPFEDNMVIFVNDYKKLSNYKVPITGTSDFTAHLNQQIGQVRKNVAVAKGSPISLDLLYLETQRLNRYIDEIIGSKQIKPSGVPILKGMKQTVSNPLEGIEEALGKIATKG